MMTAALVVCFWLAAALLIHAYAGFPALLALAGRVLDRRVAQADATPSLTLIIAAYNEEECIARRLENALAADYPAAALEVIVASDGSTDATNDIVAAFASRGVRLLALPRRGKIFALNDAVACARGDVLVFSDANTMMERGALRAIARNFADPAVGGVAGNTGYRVPEQGDAAGRGESLYWRYDTALKVLESRTGSVVSAHGGLYAIRRSLHAPLADAAVTDDFMISTGVIARGYRLVFERDARAWELPAATSGGEFRRRIRLMTRGWRAVASRRALLDPRRHGFYSVVLLSHKVLRRLVPVALLVMLASASALGESAFYRGVTVAFGLLFATAAAGFLTRNAAAGRSRLLFAPYYFCLANTAALAALYRFATGERISRWEPQRASARTSPDLQQAVGTAGVSAP